MKKTKLKKSYSRYDILGVIILLSVITFGFYFSYGLTKSFLNKDQTITSNQVWCNNCKTYHDKQTADAENQLIWCINCNKYHSPNQP